MITPEQYPAVPVELVRDFEAARMRLAGIAPRLRYAYVAGRAEGMGHEQAIRYVERLVAVRRRWHEDARACDRCEGLVLWRREGSASIAVDQSGRAHLCAEEGL